MSDGNSFQIESFVKSIFSREKNKSTRRNPYSI